MTEREDEDAEPGTVIEQDPAAGTRVAKGETVTLVVAKEPSEVPVPDVIDAAEADGRRRARGGGLQVASRTVLVETPDEDGFVLDQDPAPGHAAPEGIGGDDHGRPLRARGRPRATATPAPEATP